MKILKQPLLDSNLTLLMESQHEIVTSFHSIDSIFLRLYKLNQEIITSKDDTSLVVSECMELLKKWSEHLFRIEFYLDSLQDKFPFIVELEKSKDNYADFQFKLRVTQLQHSKDEILSKNAELIKFDENIIFETQENPKDTSFSSMLHEKNKSIALNLQKSSFLAQSTLLQNETNLQDLRESTRKLFALDESFDLFHILTSNGSNAVKIMMSQSKQERREIYGALAFFALVCLWVVWRRLLKKPVLLLLWVAVSTVKFTVLSVFRLGSARHDEL